MTGFRMASTVNLVVGLALVLVGLVGLVDITATRFFGPSDFWAVVFLSVFVLMGGYETGKYAEMRHERKVKEPVTS